MHLVNERLQSVRKLLRIHIPVAQPGVIEARVSTEKPDVYQDCRVGYEAVRRR